MLTLSRSMVLQELPLAVVLAGGFGALVVMHPRLPLWGLGVVLVFTTAVVVFRLRRYLRRLRAPQVPPDDVLVVLQALPVFQRLTTEERRLFVRNCAWFLQENRVTAVGLEVTAQHEAYVAASACLVTLGLPQHEWIPPRQIVLLPDGFHSSSGGLGGEFEHAGQFHEQGPILFAANELIDGWAVEDGYHVGIHEFAHALDWSNGDLDGVPDNTDAEAASTWATLAHKHARDARRNRRLAWMLQEDAYEDEVEFLAYVTEHFFERPDVLHEIAPALYDVLCRLYGQDPLARLPAQERLTFEIFAARMTRGDDAAPGPEVQEASSQVQRRPRLYRRRTSA